MALIVWPLRPMIRPTSLWRSCTRKIVVLPEGISESIISSGNSTSWRMTNSRNSFTRSSVFDLRGLSLFVEVGCLERGGVFTHRADFLSIGPQEPVPIIGPAADEVTVLLHEQAILVFAGDHDLDVVPRKKVALLSIRRVDDVDSAGCRPGWADKVKQLPARGELQIAEATNNRLGFLRVAASKEERR